MAEASKESLRKAIRNLHGCDSTWVEAVPVQETFQGQVAWEGTVQVFDLHGHPTAKRCVDSWPLMMTALTRPSVSGPNNPNCKRRLTFGEWRGIIMASPFPGLG